jgi:hypothetical protein
MRKIFLLLFILILPFIAHSQLVINELMTNNVSAVMDDAYNYSMWVEIYNKSTTTSYNLSAYFFSDNLAEPKKWAPLSTTITAGGYVLLYFERSDIAGHANFKLNPEGGVLYLLNNSAQVIDSVRYPAQFRNISYGRKTDSENLWVFFETYSPKASNNNKFWSAKRCGNPVFTPTGGFYSSTINVKFENPAQGDTIYYTRNGAEPTRTNSTRYTPGNSISVTSTTVLRAKCFSAGKLSGDIITASYFINERNFKLPVVSIVTEQKNLTDNTIGIYVQGTNGITGNGMSTPANWNQDWDRPANFELFDSTRTPRLNQELDIKIAGGWTRMNGQKSLKINSRKKYYENKLNYDFFKATKPNMKYRSILLRNSGNDFDHSMLRDGFMQSLVMKRMNLDYIAYEPAVCFMNGVYYGIQNLRERTDEDFVYSNYGYDQEDIFIVEAMDMATDPEYLKLTNFISTNDITQSDVYNQVCEMMDMDNFMDYFLSEIYLRNTDWPHNNIKAWKKKDRGKWRWILYDTDFGYNLWNNDYTHNTLTWALGEQSGTNPANNPWSTIMFKRLVLNETFRKRFIDKFAIQISCTFQVNRANAILDSLAAKIATEIVYHKAKWGSARAFATDINTMKSFSANRPERMLQYISSRFLGGVERNTIDINSNISNATYNFNQEKIIDSSIKLRYFRNQTIQLTANEVPAYKFKHWELNAATTQKTLVPMGDSWKYFDGSAIPATNWFASEYSDVTWKTGNAQLGYGGKGEVTTIGYGTNASNKYITAYFRKTLNISDINIKSNFVITTFIDDGAVVYVNGKELGRFNMPQGEITFNTVAVTYNNGETATFNVPADMLVEGANTIAVEVHQNAANSSDLIFNLSMTCTETAVNQKITSPVYSTVLTSDFNIKAIYEQVTFSEPDYNVVFNEIVSSNNVIKDEYGDKDDYIELFNNSDQDVNIAGWYVSDKPDNPTFYQIPTTDTAATLIPTKGRIVLWADEQPTQGVLHVGFKLSKDGESLMLSRTNYLGAIVPVDSLTFPNMEQNLSYSRVPDGTGPWVIKPTTYNMPNSDNTQFVTPEFGISIYPTLAKEYIRVINASGLVIKITDFTGKIMICHLCMSNTETIILSNLPRGIYIAIAGEQAFKIIKQ